MLVRARGNQFGRMLEDMLTSFSFSYPTFGMYSIESSKIDWLLSETTLKYWMMVERYPNLKEEVGGSIPGCEISSLLNRKLAMWSTASCASQQNKNWLVIFLVIRQTQPIRMSLAAGSPHSLRKVYNKYITGVVDGLTFLVFVGCPGCKLPCSLPNPSGYVLAPYA